MSAPVRPCVRCDKAWTRGVGGGSAKLCPTCTAARWSWCSVGQHIVSLSAMTKQQRSKCGPCQLKAVMERAFVNREWAGEVKVQRGCVDCGYAGHPSALDFDHRDGEKKSFTIGSSMSRSRAALEAEIAKCDVRCANCHRIKTVTRRRELEAAA